MVLPQHSITVAMHGANGHSGVVAVMQMHRPLEEILREQSRINRLVHYGFGSDSGEWLSTVRAFPFLAADVLLPHLSSRLRRKFVVVRW